MNNFFTMSELERYLEYVMTPGFTSVDIREVIEGLKDVAEQQKVGNILCVGCNKTWIDPKEVVCGKCRPLNMNSCCTAEIRWQNGRSNPDREPICKRCGYHITKKDINEYMDGLLDHDRAIGIENL